MLTRDRWGLNERAFAWYYPRLMAVSERSGGAELRSRVIGRAAGRTLELGAGNGYNLPHYTAAVTELVVTEPSPAMLAQLERTVRATPPAVGSWRAMAADAERLPFPDASFDTVTSGYVQCSVGDPARMVDEIARVLRPGGRYLFIEHVRADEGSLLGRVQDVIEPVHVYVAAGCHPNRRTEELLRSSSLEVEWLEHARLPMAPVSVRPLLLGSARKGLDGR
ncbi:MAG: class I SAM-dependent methyltransferase [Jatrophihabitans sp.]|uniref:class I SAM-dependent methyltransferase n=1 Tax=Jatrophihabitans sp. TaxID=1932789 RepID=UPI003F7E6ACB